MLTNEAKLEYVKAINAIWGGTMQNNSVYNINEDVVELVDKVLSEIRKGSQAMLAIDVIYNFFYSAPGSWAEVIIGAIINGISGGVSGWIDVLKGSKMYASVVNTAALRYKSAVQLALYGI